MKIVDEIFLLIKNEINNEPLKEDVEYDVKRLFIASARHDLAHLIGDALLRNKVITDGKVAELFRQQADVAVYRYEQQNSEYQRIRALLNNAGIPFMPLKGLVLRKFYPEPWMRTCCDLDVLIHEEDLEKATELLVKNGFKTDGKKNYHDRHFYSDDVHLELHHNICENNKQFDGVLKKVWDYAEKTGDYEYAEVPEYFVFHHVAHMAYHFLCGGCGIRPFIDLWILKEKKYYDEEKLLALLEEGELVRFYNSVCDLLTVWINGTPREEFMLRMEKYVVKGGIYGTANSSMAAHAAKNKGRKKYLFKIAFPPYKTMCEIYPSLKKCGILLPFYYIYRAFAKTFGKDRKRVKARIVCTMSQSKENVAEISELLENLGLQKAKDFKKSKKIQL